MVTARQTFADTKSHGLGFGRSLKGKLLILFLALSVIPLIAIGVISFIRSEDALRELAQEEVVTVRDLQRWAVQEWVDERLSEVGMIAELARVSSMNRQTASEAIKQYHGSLGIYETMLLTDMNGVSVASHNDAEYQLADRPYMQQALRGEAVVSDPIISRDTGNVIISVAYPVVSEGRQVGVMVATLPTNAFVEIMQLGWSGETGDAYLMNNEGYVFTPPRFTDDMRRLGIINERAELELKVDTHGVREALAGREGVDFYTNYADARVVGAYAPVPVPGTQWVMVIDMQEAEAFAAVTELRNIILLIGLVAAAVVAFVAFVVARSVANPVIAVTAVARGLALGDIDQTVEVRANDEIGQLGDAFRQMIAYQREMAHAADRIAAGDLTADVTPQSERDALGHSFVQMIANLRRSIGRVRSNALNLASASEQISASADQSAQASQQVAATIQQVAQGTSQQTEAVTQATFQTEQMAAAVDGIAKGAQEQARAVEGASRVVEQMAAVIAQVAGNAQSSADASDEAARAAEGGAETVNATVEVMSTIRTRVTDVGEKVRQMEDQSAQIGAIVETIDDIAEQTNLLALNAAIEAARAGEQGRGFAVVADEVRKLAERSGQATKEIAGLIQTVQTNIADAVQAMEASLEQVESGSVRANEAGEALKQILAASQVANRQVIEIAAAAERMSASSDELASAMESVSAIVEENTASAEESAASTGEITSAMENIASISEENSTSAEEVSAMTEEMSAQAEEVTAAAQSLAEMAAQLQEVVSGFVLPDIEEEGDALRPQARASTFTGRISDRPTVELAHADDRRTSVPVVGNGNGRA